MRKSGGNFRGNRDECIIKCFTGGNWDGCDARTLAFAFAERSLSPRDIDMVHVL